MTEGTMDSGQAEGTSGNTNSSGSQGEGDKQGSAFDPAKLQSAFEDLTRLVKEVDARTKALQGDKDRGVNKTSEQVKELKQKIAEIEKIKKVTGVDDEAAYEEFDFRETVRSIKDQLALLNPTPTGNGAVDSSKVIIEAGLDAKDPAVIAAFAGKQFASTAEAEAIAWKLAAKKANQPQPSDADKAATPGNTPAQGLSTQDIETKAGKLREMYKAPTKNKAQIESLEKELEQYLPK